jgi:hypothetical protein
MESVRFRVMAGFIQFGIHNGSGSVASFHGALFELSETAELLPRRLPFLKIPFCLFR